MTVFLPKPQRDTLAAVTLDAVRTVEARALPGPSKFNAARALSMRKLKALGMPQRLRDAIGTLEGGDTDDLDGELDEAEKAVVDAVAGAAGVGVGVIADKIEDDTGCVCNTQIVALLRALVEVGIEAAYQGIKSAVG